MYRSAAIDQIIQIQNPVTIDRNPLKVTAAAEPTTGTVNYAPPLKVDSKSVDGKA